MAVGLCVAVLGVSTYAQAQATYQVTITNLTRGQVITPPVLLSHGSDFELFTEGMPARGRLVTLAESGSPDHLAEKFQNHPQVFDFVAGSNVIFPGNSLTLELSADSSHPYFTAVGMLAQTNDAFFGLNSALLPEDGEMVFFAPALDAGSEANNENSAYIPGPPFGGSERSAANSENFVHIHAGIQGIGDLAPETYDWRNPVVKITVVRTN